MLPRMADTILLERRGPLLLIGINRPEKRNAFDVEMYVSLARAYGELDADPDLRVAVVHAIGGHFTAGLDLAKWTGLINAGQWPELPEGARDPFGLDAERRVGKPLVFAVQGYCYTVGLELMLAADVRVAGSDTRFAALEVKRGFNAFGGATVRLVHEIGWANAMRYLLTGDELLAPEAHRLGLVQEVVEPSQVLERGLAVASAIAAQAPLAVQATLASARLALREAEAKSFAALMPALLPLMKTDDAREGFQAFVERRAAKFTGR
jgi:enoyl-CoA hydratase